ncbi:MAG: VIT domain-containing protein [candidate division WOR-3 bacterium]
MNHGRLVLTVLAIGLAAQALAGLPDTTDRTLSPYFLVKSEDPKSEQLPLLATGAEVDIAGVIADVRVTQVYRNSGKKAIEAIYVFPASTRAAVYALKMTIGTRTVVAEIQEREQARRNYEQALNQGRTASLLEQERPNVFQMNVGNIMPGDTIRVELSYTELLVPTEGTYEFVYPTVVGPRYTTKTEKSASDVDRWTETPYLHQGEKPPYAFSLGVKLNAGMPVSEITSPSHKLVLRQEHGNAAAISLDPAEKWAGNRDFVLRYRLAGGAIQSGLLLFEGKDEKFFLAMVQPPKRERLTAMPILPREYIFIVDVSGSMYGFPLEVSKALLKDLISSLKPTDCFNVLLFAGGNTVMAEQSVPATKENIARALKVISEQQGGGGTELLPALKRALNLPRTKGTSRTVVIATDGYVSVEPEAFDLIRQNLGDANMFTFGIGSSVNRHLIEGMARVGMGEPFVVENEAHAPAAAERFRRYVERPVLTGVRVRFDGFDAYDVEPKSIPDVMAERPVIVFGKWRGRATGVIEVAGTTGSGQFRQALNVAHYGPAQANSALRYLWARQRVQLLSDYNNLSESDSRKQEVVALGLKYNLLTQYTSFVAIDTRIRNRNGKPEVVKQPLPLPEGVSDYAVGEAAAGYGGAVKSAVGMARSLMPTTAQPRSLDAAEPGPSVRILELKVGSGANVPGLRQALEAILPDIEAAYLTELAGTPGLKGTLKLNFRLEPDGTVTNVRLETNQLGAGLGRRVKELIEGLSVENRNGRSVGVTVKFEFAQ